METADELFNSWSNIVGIEVRYIKLNNLTVDEFKDIKPKGIEEKIEKTIRAKYHFPDKIAEPTESDDVSADSINVDTLGFE